MSQLKQIQAHLAARINDLRNMGCDIHTEIKKTTSGKRVAVYVMGAV